VIALGVYPQVILEGSEEAVRGVPHQEVSVIR